MNQVNLPVQVKDDTNEMQNSEEIQLKIHIILTDNIFFVDGINFFSSKFLNRSYLKILTFNLNGIAFNCVVVIIVINALLVFIFILFNLEQKNLFIYLFLKLKFDFFVKINIRTHRHS